MKPETKEEEVQSISNDSRKMEKMTKQSQKRQGRKKDEKGTLGPHRSVESRENVCNRSQWDMLNFHMFHEHSKSCPIDSDMVKLHLAFLRRNRLDCAQLAASLLRLAAGRAWNSKDRKLRWT